MMRENKLLKYSEYIITILFFTGIFIFFAFFYNNHLHFEEQIQLFLLTGEYFISKMAFPGGFAGYLSGFLTQFYYLSFAGPLIIALLLFGIQQIFRLILKVINQNNSFFPLSFLPSLNCAMILCDEFYSLSAVTGVLIALLLSWLYISFKRKTKRFYAGLVLIPLTYWLAGGSFLMLVSIIILFEIITGIRSGRKKVKKDTKETIYDGRLKIWQMAVYIFVGAVIPLLVRRFLIMQPLGLTYLSEFYYDLRTTVPVAIPVLFSLPAIIMLIYSLLPLKEKPYYPALYIQIILLMAAGYFGFRQWANFSAEDIMKYDYLVRNERWDDVIKFAEKKAPRNNLSLAMLNLSLAKTEKMGDLMFHFEQNGTAGLFLPFEREYVAPMMGSEILFHLGLINASQEYSFESMETIPDLNKSVRSIKRLAETNLINGHYKVAGKYLRFLKKTLFYRKWASDTEQYLYNEEMINNHPVWGKKREMMIKEDFFFKVENMESTLNMLMRGNPANNIAFQYLMAFYLINKDLRNFMNCLPMMEPLGYKKIPVSYEEAIMYVIGLTTTNPMEDIPFKISEETKARMKAYAGVYTTTRNAETILRDRFNGTYWYYLHFK